MNDSSQRRGDECEPIDLALSGYDLLLNPLLNKGTAFTEKERRDFDLDGLLPPHVSTLPVQIERRLIAIRSLPDDNARHVFLRELQDTNETLFYALVSANLEEMLPLVYTPAVGYGCRQFSRLFRRPRGVFLSMPNEDLIGRILSHRRFNDVKAIVVTDGERVLGLGDQGVGGMGISIGKTAIYTACAGLHPTTTLPVFLDVGTDNPDLLSDPLYVGWRHERVRGQAYDQFIETFVAAAITRWPRAILQWEDFARQNAGRLLGKYRNRLCTFNDDIQGTAAAATATLLSASLVTGTSFASQRLAIFGAGSAGCGIARLAAAAMRDAGLTEESARSRIFLIDRQGLLTESMTDLSDDQRYFAKTRSEIDARGVAAGSQIDLLEAIAKAKITALIGVSGKAGAFGEPVVRALAKNTARPIILPLSNPTTCSEADPQDLFRWADGRAVIGTGSPFPPVVSDGLTRKFDQTNNAYIFPGLALGAIASGATRISDAMFLAAAKKLAQLSPAHAGPGASLLPPIGDLRQVAQHIAVSVGLQAQNEGLAPASTSADLAQEIASLQWKPDYSTYRRRNTAAQ